MTRVGPAQGAFGIRFAGTATRIPHRAENGSVSPRQVNSNPSDIAVFALPSDSAHTPTTPNFAPEVV